MSTKLKGRRLGDYVVLMEKELGKGSFAVVYKGYRHDNPTQFVAVKQMSKKTIEQTPKIKQTIEFETSLLKRTDLDHTNVLKLLDVKKTANNWYLIFEFCSGGDLSVLLRKYRGRMPEPLLKRFMCNIIMGLKALHDIDIIHRDLKPANILLTSPIAEEASLKIADFGLARKIEPFSLADTICGSPLYMGVEVLGKKKYGKPADIWSAGCIFYEMCTGKTPFTGGDLSDLIKNHNLLTPDFSIVPRECRQMIELMLNKDPLKRPTTAQLTQYPYLKQTFAQLYPQLPAAVTNAPPPKPDVPQVLDVPQEESLPQQERNVPTVIVPVPAPAPAIVEPTKVERPIAIVQPPSLPVVVEIQKSTPLSAIHVDDLANKQSQSKPSIESAQQPLQNVAPPVSQAVVEPHPTIPAALPTPDNKTGKSGGSGSDEEEIDPETILRIDKVLQEWPEDEVDDELDKEKELKRGPATPRLDYLTSTSQVEYIRVIFDFSNLQYNVDDTETNSLVSQLEEQAKRAWAIAEAAYLHEVLKKKSEAMSLYMAALKLLVYINQDMKRIRRSTKRSKAIGTWTESKFTELLERTVRLSTTVADLKENKSPTVAEKLLFSYAISLLKEANFKMFLREVEGALTFLQRARLALEYLLFDSRVFDCEKDKEAISKMLNIVKIKQAEMSK